MDSEISGNSSISSICAKLVAAAAVVVLVVLTAKVVVTIALATSVQK
jgi:hypothetical protein